MIRLRRKPVMPRKPPMLFLMMPQIFSASVGKYRSRFGIIFSALTSICCRSAELIFAGAAEIDSTGEPFGKGVEFGAAVAEGEGEGLCGGGVPSKKFTSPDDAVFPRLLPPTMRLY